LTPLPDRRMLAPRQEIDMADIETRLARLEAEAAIRQLIARYCFTIDNHDLEGAGALFADDAVVRSADGVMNAKGVDAIVAQYRGRFEVLGVGNHFTHDIALDFQGDDRATGLVSAHAELWRKEQMMIAAIRYQDSYRRTPRGWLFAERVINFLYYVPLTEYHDILGRTDRVHAYDRPQPADYPETLPSWIAYERSR
jgi:uncharacterized protein (TIGR02246 family)